ncbi:MAG: DHH family phosphoesterase [Negativicutes bacterium]|nr:DHH family phosphoesterase [Negativicutes bacterium]
MAQGPSFWFDTRIYLAVSAALLVVIGFYNHYAAVLGAILLYVLYLYGRERQLERQKALTAYLESMTHHIDQASYYALQNLPLAIAIVDQTGAIHWSNSVLSDWADQEILPGQAIQDIWPEMPLAKMQDQAGMEIVHFGPKHYQIIFKPVVDYHAEQKLMILYITDITSTETVREECLGARPVIAHIQIDNYDDVLKGLSESQRTAIPAEVNQKLVEWVTGLDGYLKKYGEDIYIALFNRQALDAMLAEKFDILDKVRAIRGGNRIPVTLSIGVAADEISIAALGQRARAGLDLALGRGGDQAAVYVEGKVMFYGGKAKAVEKNTRVKARIMAQAIRDIIADADSVLIMGHAGEDFDSLGAALGVARMVRFMGKPVRIVVSQQSIAVSKLSELVDEYAAYSELLITGEQAEAIATAETLLFVVDTHRPEITAAPGLLSRLERVVVIDHHRRSENFIANPLLVYLEPSASSTSELVAELLTYFDDKLDLTRVEATALYAGIILDTKNFAVQTGVRTFDAAAYLRRSGADPALVRRLFRVDMETFKRRAEIINNTDMLPGGVVLATYPRKVKNGQIIAAQVADMLLNIEGVRVSFVIFPADDGVGISARSQGDINVQIVMEQLGGGGHQTVAGAQIKGASIEEVKPKLIGIINNYIRESAPDESHLTARSEKTW